MELNSEMSIVMKNGTKILSTTHYRNVDIVDEWFLMGSPLPITMILVSYLLFVLKIGPAYMKKREPYKFHNIILLHNAVQAFQMMVPYGLLPKTCVMDIENTRRRISIAIYCYLCAKITELLDTIFFVIRKKDNQVTFLHVYHHTLMVVVSWTALKYEPSYTLMFLGLVNSFVHVIMYTYYGLSSFPSLAKYLWWKKYITSMQLIQFIAIFLHFVVAAMKSECTPSYILSAALTFNLILFLYLFGTFYINTYNKKIGSKAGFSNGIKIVNEVNNEVDSTGNVTKCATTSKNLNNTYRIKINFESKKFM